MFCVAGWRHDYAREPARSWCVNRPAATSTLGRGGYGRQPDWRRCERFLTGDRWLDPGLLDALVAKGAVVVATIRRNALTVYRPRDEARLPQWETISRFTRVDLSRRLSAEESRIVEEQVADSEVRAGTHRYGLAEYLGAGPDAVERLNSGDTECPVGAALVRGAIDWRRAGLARLVRRRDLCAALPIYLRDRPAAGSR
jgi:hypothetical protein